VKESLDQTQDFPDDEDFDISPNQALTLSDQDRFVSRYNIARGYEEFILDREGRIISSNLEAVNITGYEEWEVIGKHFSILYTNDDKHAFRPAEDLKTAEELGRVLYSGWLAKKKGISFWAKVRIQVMRNKLNAIAGYRMVVKDATNNAIYGYRVKQIRDEYLNLFNNSFIGIFKIRVCDRKVLVLNDKAVEMLGRGEQEDITFDTFFKDPSIFKSFIDTVQEKESIENFEVEIVNGVWVSICCRYFNQGGFVEGVLSDITQQKKQLVELQRLNNEIDTLIYHASHDIRAPLTTILGLTHLITLDNPTRITAEYNIMIQEQIRHLDYLLKSLVNISFNNQTDVHLEPISFEREVEVILREFRQLYPTVKVITEYEGSTPFFSDVSRICIILKNLIGNAFRYNNQQPDNAWVRIKISCHTDKTTIAVEDNGIGIDAKYLQKIFSMFFKAERGSTGLGLYIVKAIVEKLGGHLEVHSERWKGSTFKVELQSSTTK
jgi:PAS domain S-box-containing protein